MPVRSTEIAGLTVKEDTDTLCIGTDSLLCAAYVRPSAKAHAVELGAGCGVISLLLLAHEKIQLVDAVEIQPASAELCRENAANNGLSDRMTVFCDDIRSLSPSNHVGISIAITNPPYMKTGHGKKCVSEAMENARHESNGDIYDFCKCAAKLLKTGGSFYTVYRPDRLPALTDALLQNRLSPKRMTFVYADDTHSPSSVLIEARKDGGESLYVTPPLMLRQGMSDSAEMLYIYENGVFPKRFLTP
ncbi:MAG: methyltransferase [Clostridia bacterium]|nr:methyltransferase [Clostridia bacterium]